MPLLLGHLIKSSTQLKLSFSYLGSLDIKTQISESIMECFEWEGVVFHLFL